MSQICCQRKLPVVTASKHIMAGVAARCAGRALLRPVIFGGDGDGYCCSSRRKGSCEEGFSGMQWSRRLMNVVAHLQRCADLRLMGLAWLCTQKGGFFWGFACFLSTEETGCIFMVEPRMPAATFSSKKRLKSVVTKAAARDSLYAILNVSPSATEKEIKQAYRRLALKYHPDVNKAPDAQAKFLEIKHAYQTLSDVNSRRKYDATRTSSPSWEPFTWDDASRTQTQSKTGAKEEFYGLDDFLRDLQSEFEQKSSQGQPKSLWEELADIGEEFVEFLEKELDIVDESGVYREPARKGNLYEYDLKNDESATERKSRAESDGKEIEEMLAQLKKELGL